MGRRAGTECLPNTESAAWRVCEQLDDNPAANWQWCGPAQQTFEGTRVVSFNEAAGSAVLRMHCDSSYGTCGAGFDSATGRNITFNLAACDEWADPGFLEPVVGQVEVVLATLLAVGAVMRFFRARRL